MKLLWNESIRIDRIEAEDRWGPGANIWSLFSVDLYFKTKIPGN